MNLLVTVLMALTMVLTVPAQAKSELPVLKLSKDNTAILFGVVDATSVSDVMQQVQKLNSSLKSGYPINLVLYTPGGSIQDGLELMEYLKSINRPVNTVTMFAASMGFQIAQNLGQRYILQSGVLMSHKAQGGFEGEFGDGNSQIDSRYGLWMERILEMDNQTVKRTKGKQTLKSYRAAYQNEMWITGKQSVERGYADKVVSVSCDSSLSGIRTQQVEFLGMSIDVSFSQCPLNTSPLSIERSIPTNKGIMKHQEFLAKGGVFLKDHKEANSYMAPDLYCTDPTLTMESLKQSLADLKKEILVRQKKIVKGY